MISFSEVFRVEGSGFKTHLDGTRTRIQTHDTCSKPLLIDFSTVMQRLHKISQRPSVESDSELWTSFFGLVLGFGFLELRVQDLGFGVWSSGFRV